MGDDEYHQISGMVIIQYLGFPICPYENPPIKTYQTGLHVQRITNTEGYHHKGLSIEG
jgi:hypothetical protein